MTRRIGLLTLAALTLTLSGGCSGAEKRTLLVYCAAGLRVPVEAAAKEYEESYGVRVELQYGASGPLLNSIKVSKRGDVYIPADDDYLIPARQQRLIAETVPLVVMHPVLAVRKNSEWAFDSLEQIPKDECLALADPAAAAVGRLTREALGEKGYAKLSARAATTATTVVEVANAIKVGSVKGGIIWDAMLVQYPDLRALDVADLRGQSSTVSAVVTRCSQQPTEALRFARFLASPERGRPHFVRNGYKPLQGDAWEESPELRLMCGAMLRPAVEQTLSDFEQREGVTITRVYNGCGILTASMRAEGAPDGYFACDACFVDQVADLFDKPVTVSRNDVVIVVPRGNPKSIRTLKDLTKSGVSVGVARPKQSALGVLTERLLVKTGLMKKDEEEKVIENQLAANVEVESATGDFLINQLRTGSLDAVIAYRSNVVGTNGSLEAIDIPLAEARASQPFVIARNTRYPRLMGRLLAAIRSAESKDRFREAGFRWAGD